MGLPRLALQPDARLAAAVLGLAAAFLLPLGTTMLVAGLEARVDPAQQWLAYREDGGSLDLSALGPPQVAMARRDVAGQVWVGFAAGPSPVAPGHALAESAPIGGTLDLDGRALTVDGAPGRLPLVPPGAHVVHLTDLGAAPVVAALYAQAPVPAGGLLPHGVTVVPARGADAFEQAATQDLRASAGVVVAASVPAVAVVAGVFAQHEMRERLKASAILASLGGWRQAKAVLAVRILLAVGGGAAVALAVAYLLYRWGGPLFHPSPFPKASLAAAGLVPTLAAFATAAVALRGFAGKVEGALQGDERAPSAASATLGAAETLPARLRWPLTARPILLGSTGAPVLLVCALLFAVDVGFPLAAGQVPAAMAGGPGEWVVGAKDGLQAGRGVAAGSAGVLGHDPAIDAIVAETVAPTRLGGAPAVLRCGTWEALAAYHGLDIAAGVPPAGAGIAVGSRLAQRHGWRVGDGLWAQGADVAFVVQLTVTGIAAAPGLLADEAFCDAGLGQRLVGLGAGQASVVRFRPQTQDAQAAYGRTPARIEVVGLALDPPAPQAGTWATVTAAGVNLGAQPGARDLTLRVNGFGAANATLHLAGHTRGEVRMGFVVPPGPLQLEVNPALDAAGTPAPARLDVPALAFPGHDVQVVLRGADGSPLAGVEVGTFTDADAATRGLPLATARTGDDGTATLPAPGHDAVVAALGPPAALAPLRSGTRYDAADVHVLQAWSTPASPGPGEAATLHATLLNRGGLAGSGHFEVRRGEGIIQFIDATLASGELRTVAVPYVLAVPTTSLTVGNTTVRLGTREAEPPPPQPGAPAPAPPPGPPGALAPVPQAGEAVRTRLADRALGQARPALLALAGTSLTTTLAVVVLATKRSLASRTHVQGLLQALGQDATQIRARAAWEAGIMAGAAMVVALPLAKLAFALLATPWGPTAYGHSLPDPIGWLFAAQAIAAFSALGALTAYNVAGRGPGLNP